MTLLTEHMDAGWHEVEASGEKWAAERFVSLPGASSSVVRVEAESSKKLQEAVTLRESQLAGRLGLVKDVVSNDGSLVTGEQHEAIRTTDGVAVAGEAAAPDDKDAEIEALREQLAEAQAAAEASPPDAPEEPAPAPEADPAPADAGVGEAPAAPQE